MTAHDIMRACFVEFPSLPSEMYSGPAHVANHIIRDYATGSIGSHTDEHDEAMRCELLMDLARLCPCIQREILMDIVEATLDRLDDDDYRRRHDWIHWHGLHPSDIASWMLG